MELLYPSKEETIKIRNRKSQRLLSIRRKKQLDEYNLKLLNDPDFIEYELDLIETEKKERKERYKINFANWRRKYPEKAKEHSKRDEREYYIRHKEKIQTRVKRWRNTPSGKISESKHNSKRRKMLGYDILNNWFEGCEQHHINSAQVVCIPKEIHRRYPHNHSKPDTMIEINRIAMQYLFNCKM